MNTCCFANVINKFLFAFCGIRACVLQVRFCTVFFNTNSAFTTPMIFGTVSIQPFPFDGVLQCFYHSLISHRRIKNKNGWEYYIKTVNNGRESSPSPAIQLFIVHLMVNMVKWLHLMVNMILKLAVFFFVYLPSLPFWGIKFTVRKCRGTEYYL